MRSLICPWALCSVCYKPPLVGFCFSLSLSLAGALHSEVETGAAEQGQRQEPMSHKPAAPTEPEQAAPWRLNFNIVLLDFLAFPFLLEVAVPKLYASLQVPPVESAKPKMIEDNDGEISQPRKGVLCAVEAETVAA